MVDYILRKSLEEGRIIRIIYQKDRAITERDIRVTEISGDSVRAYCYMRNQVRVFRKACILSAQICGGTDARHGYVRDERNPHTQST